MMNTVRLTLRLLVICCAAVSFAQASSLEKLVTQYMYDTYRLDSATTSIEITRTTLKTDDVTPSQVRFQPLSTGEPKGPFILIAEIVKNGHVIDRGQVRLNIHKFGEVLVTADRIRRHERLAATKFVRKRMEITSLQEQPVTAPDAVSGFRSTRNLPKGKILTRSALEPVPDIEVGREVSIILDNGLYVLTAPGRAMQDGRAGQYVRVKNLSSGKIIVAKVVDARSVAIDP